MSDSCVDGLELELREAEVLIKRGVCAAKVSC